MSSPTTCFDNLEDLAAHLRGELEVKKFVLIYAYNGIGKTRLSMAFKDIGKQGDARDTLYFNAFTEDLFTWDNDLEEDKDRVLKINSASQFFVGLAEMEMDTRIRRLLNRYADFDFKIDVNEGRICFSRQVTTGSGEDARTESVENIKISRGEENIFIWCFFLAIVQLRLDDDDGTGPYKWVKYIYIDDPISSLDEHNAIAVANHLSQMLTTVGKGPSTVVSSHHALFFNVLSNELKKKAHRHFLKKGAPPDGYVIQDTTSKPFLHHLATLVELNDVQSSGALYTHHFNMMRRVMEQTANFFGLADWKECIKVEEDDPDITLYKRIIDLMSHGDYSLYEPKEMMDENKEHFRKVFRQFIVTHPFNETLFVNETK